MEKETDYDASSDTGAENFSVTNHVTILYQLMYIQTPIWDRIMKPEQAKRP